MNISIVSVCPLKLSTKLSVPQLHFNFALNSIGPNKPVVGERKLLNKHST